MTPMAPDGSSGRGELLSEIEALRRRCAELERVAAADPDQRLEEERQRVGARLRSLNEAAVFLAALSPDQDLYQFVASTLAEMTNALFVAVNEYV